MDTISFSTTLNLAVAAVPTAIEFSPGTGSIVLADNLAAGSPIVTGSVTMSDGSAFAGTWSVAGADWVQIDAQGNITTSRALTKADIGEVTLSVSATVPVVPAAATPAPAAG
jgi:hypothetical protein